MSWVAPREKKKGDIVQKLTGWHKTVEQPWQMTTVFACEKTVVIVKQPGHLTSIKKERGLGTRVFWKGICVSKII